TIAGIAGQVEAALQGERKEQAPPLQPVSREQQLPLSFAQQRLWFVEQLNPGTSTYNKPLAVWLRGSLSFQAPQSSLAEIVRRDEVWRTTFPSQEGLPVQRVAPAEIFTLVRLDLSGLPEREREPEALRLARQEKDRPFDLGQGPLLRAYLVQVTEQQ